MEHTWRFKKAEHEDFGTYGWLLEGAPSTYVPLSGMGIAHDVLEHLVGDTGTIEEELMALGAALYIRGDGGYWNKSYHSPGVHIGSDVGNDLAYKYGGLENGINCPGRTYKLEAYVEEWIQNAIDEARKNIKDQLDGWDLAMPKSKINAYLKNVPGWIRRGYRSALKRYKHCGSHKLTEVFNTIEQKANKYLSHCEGYETLVITFNPKKACQLRIYMDEDYPDYE